MKISRKVLRDKKRNEYVELLTELLKTREDVLRVGSNEIAFPIVDDEGNEDFIVITVKVPTGANKGTEPYDGYAMAEDYEMHLKEKAEKRQKPKKQKLKKLPVIRHIERQKRSKKKKEQSSNALLFLAYYFSALKR